MEWKKNTLWVFALLGMMVIGTAMTVVVQTEAEAQAKIGRQVALVAGPCRVLSIDKGINTPKQIANRPYSVEFEFRYTKDGEQSREVKTIEATNTNEATIKSLVGRECDTIWAELQARNEKIDRVVIRPDISHIVIQVYDVVKRQWSNIVQP